MTVVVVPFDPLDAALPDLPETAPLSSDETRDLYRAMLADSFRAAADSGGELLVNYPEGAEAAAREVAADAGVDEDARFEVQVGSSRAARAGNVVTHLLREEGEDSVAVVPGDAPLLARTDVDSAAMKLRSNEVVLGPASDGDVYFAAFAEPVDFTDAYVPPAVTTLAELAAEAEYDVAFLPQQTRVATGADLASVVATVRARLAARRRVPEQTARAIADLGLAVEPDDGDVRLARE